MRALCEIANRVPIKQEASEPFPSRFDFRSLLPAPCPRLANLDSASVKGKGKLPAPQGTGPSLVRFPRSGYPKKKRPCARIQVFQTPSRKLRLSVSGAHEPAKVVQSNTLTSYQQPSRKHLDNRRIMKRDPWPNWQGV
ncbi:predicted protein [Histoplasma capsulatum G186AR]|uniref:Uncharacterized protein n=1 Tax=Ajellomyces capsulatus (strain G186AR / H82 / ATCC MYA-2454 / RMSCC 2432) TaxID=447093 RepID=C0NU11_AJECG|nr:uncharacterized protein HCBG_06641 [Histoplasma capsulatum G186AR]EEH05522.1 predicted protein [Histoplasma capsulatum G186AR]